MSGSMGGGPENAGGQAYTTQGASTTTKAAKNKLLWEQLMQALMRQTAPPVTTMPGLAPGQTSIGSRMVGGGGPQPTPQSILMAILSGKPMG